MASNFRPPLVGDPTTARAMDGVRAGFSAAEPKSGTIQKGILLEDVELDTTTTYVVHKLGRAPSGWLVVRRVATGVDVWEDEAPSTTDYPRARFLPLVAAGACTVSLWVF